MKVEVVTFSLALFQHTVQLKITHVVLVILSRSGTISGANWRTSSAVTASVYTLDYL